MGFLEHLGRLRSCLPVAKRACPMTPFRMVYQLELSFALFGFSPFASLLPVVLVGVAARKPFDWGCVGRDWATMSKALMKG